MPKLLSDRWVSLALMLLTLVVVGTLLTGGVPVTGDDGFYYFKIAQHIAQGGGSTFDGIHPTNGYHPLWLILLVPIFLFSPSAHVALTMATIVQGILWASGVVVLYRTARLICGYAASSFAALLWIAFTYRLALGGLEFGLESLLVMSTAYIYARRFIVYPTEHRYHYLLLGLLLSLTFLARIDTVPLVAIIAFLLLSRELSAGFSRTSTERLLLFTLPIAVAVLAYISINLWLFGHVLPVSSIVKRDWSNYLLVHDPLYQSSGWFAAKSYQLLLPLFNIRETYPVVFGVLGTIGLLLIWSFNVRRARHLLWLRNIVLFLGPFMTFGILQVFVLACIYHGSLSSTPSYFVVQLWIAGILAGILFERSLQLRHSIRLTQQSWIRVRWFISLVLLVVWLSIPVHIFRGIELWKNRERPDPLREAAKWVRANLPTDAVIGAWNAGAIGFLSERTVVNLDGLVNSWEFCSTDRYDLCGYWRKNGITYLVDVFENREALSAVPTYASYRDCADKLELVWSDQRYNKPWRVEVYRISPSKY